MGWLSLDGAIYRAPTVLIKSTIENSFFSDKNTLRQNSVVSRRTVCVMSSERGVFSTGELIPHWGGAS